MDISPLYLHPSSWPFFLSPRFFFPAFSRPENYVHRTETPESHVFSADLPGVRKEEIRVEVEDSRYLVIRIERDVGSREEDGPAKSFMRKFRLPERVDVDGISADYENGVLTVTVPTLHVRRQRRIEPEDLAGMRELLLARAA